MLHTYELKERLIRGTGPWNVEGLSLMSLFLSSLTPTPEAPVQRKGSLQVSKETHIDNNNKNREKPCHERAMRKKVLLTLKT